MRAVVCLILLLLPLAAIGAPVEYHEENAVLINLTEAHLNRIVQDLFTEHGGERIDGGSARLNKHVSELSYSAGLSAPRLTLSEGGTARVELEVLDAELTIGRIERQFLFRKMTCRDAGVRVDPETPLELSFEMQFAVEDNDVRIVPQQVHVANTERVKLKRPERCNNNPLPERFLWWLAKGKLRKKFAGIDKLLLERAHEGADQMVERGNRLARRWHLGNDEDADREELHLYPQSVQTVNGSLLIGMAGSSPAPAFTFESMPTWVAEASHDSFLGLSESFVNQLLRGKMSEVESEPHKPRGSLRKLFRSDAIYSLIPGLRQVEDRDELRLSLKLHATPTIEFDETDQGRAMIRLLLSNIEFSISDGSQEEPTWMGSIVIDSARIGLLPYYNVLGGISLEALENEWEISSSGVEFDEETFAATLQELLFGEIFETSYAPLAGDGVDVGATRFDPRYFQRVENYLVIGLNNR